MIFEIDCAYCLRRHEVTGRHVAAFSGSRAKYWEGNESTGTVLVSRSVRRLLEKHGDARLVIKVGDATGIDEWVHACCSVLGICHEVLRANWRDHGSFAGHERNGRVVEGADELIAISRPGERPTAGTGNAIYQAERRGIPVYQWRGRWIR